MTFLRPWFLLLIFLPFLLRLFKDQLEASSAWQKVIDEKLLPYLLIKGTNATAKRRRIFKITLWTLFSIAMAGPAWDKMEVPTHTYQPGTVIVMELSPAMTGNNLERAKQKIYDILGLLKGEQVGLVLYDRFGYTAGPLTFETDIIKDMIPYLDPSVLPEQKSNPAVGFEQAENLFKNADIKQGRILFLISGAFLNPDFEEIAKKSTHKIGILGIGPAEPHPIPKATGGFMTDRNGKTMMIHFDQKKLSKIGAFQVMTMDDTDIQTLIEETIPDESEIERLSNERLSIWRDRGGIFVAILLPFFALLFRKSLMLVILLFWVMPAEASLWLRPDQEIYKEQMNAVGFYKKGLYERAENLFKKSPDIEALYNRGNTLAYQQKIQDAIQVYQDVLSKNPAHKDAKFNKEYLEKELEKEKQEQQKQEEEPPEQQDEQQPPEEQEQPPEEQSPPEEQQEQQEQEKQLPEQQDEQQQPEEQEQSPEEQEQPEEKQDVQPQENRDQGELESLKEENEEPIFDQESEKVLNQLPTDVDSVLRYRINQQYNKYIGR